MVREEIKEGLQLPVSLSPGESKFPITPITPLIRTLFGVQLPDSGKEFASIFASARQDQTFRVYLKGFCPLAFGK